MRVLVVHDTVIQAWLVGETAESAPVLIQHGYPQLLPALVSGALAAIELEVPEGDEFRSDLYEVADGTVRRKSE